MGPWPSRQAHQLLASHARAPWSASQLPASDGYSGCVYTAHMGNPMEIPRMPCWPGPIPAPTATQGGAWGSLALSVSLSHLKKKQLANYHNLTGLMKELIREEGQRAQPSTGPPSRWPRWPEPKLTKPLGRHGGLVLGSPSGSRTVNKGARSQIRSPTGHAGSPRGRAVKISTILKY